jgi:predicted transcriptional regulator
MPDAARVQESSRRKKGKKASSLKARLDVMTKLLAISNDRFLLELKKAVRNNKEVLELCDGTRNLSDIAKSAKKDESNLSKTLDRLEKSGIIFIDRQDGVEKYYRYVLPPDSPFIPKDEEVE